MARPIKKGLEYFPMDTDFFADKKIRLLRGEFGAAGLLVLLATYCRIYDTEGYWASFDDDDAILTADELGCGITAQTVRDIIQCAVRRGLFDRRIFEEYGVLTSHGIQRRFVVVSAKRGKIGVIAEYWLLDENNVQDVPASIRGKIEVQGLDTPAKSRTEIREEQQPEEPQQAPLNSYIEQNLFSMSPGNWEDLRDLMDAGISEELVRYAVDKAVGNGKRAWSYTRSILNNWLVKGFKTVEEAKNEHTQPAAPQLPTKAKGVDKPVRWF